MTTQNEEARAKDRELLELAAKAASMNVLPLPWPDEDGWFFCVTHGDPCLHFRKLENPYHHTPPWKPFTDDGDALRLAAKLKMFDEMAQFQWNLSVMQEKFSDPAEAIRRAIVETAVEIERAKS